MMGVLFEVAIESTEVCDLLVEAGKAYARAEKELVVGESRLFKGFGKSWLKRKNREMLELMEANNWSPSDYMDYMIEKEWEEEEEEEDDYGCWWAK